MRFGVYVPTFGEYDVETLAGLARDVEAAGWHGFFIWDHLAWTPDGGQDLADTTVALTAITLATDRVRFGALVTPLARRRPWKLAKEWATLDRLSGGRLVVGVGLGAKGDRLPFDDGAPPESLAGQLDEGLELVESLWSGQPVITMANTSAFATPCCGPRRSSAPASQSGVAGFWPNRRPFRRAARWDGALPLTCGHLMKELSARELRKCRDFISAHRTSSDPFDLVAFVAGQPRTPEMIREYEEAGATWWIEAVDPSAESLAEFRARIAGGPIRSGGH